MRSRPSRFDAQTLASLALILALTLAAGCGGGGSGGGPATPLSALTGATIPAGAQNPPATVNAATANGFFVNVDFNADSRAGDPILIIVTDANGQQVFFTDETIVGPGSMAYGPIDVSGLADGPLDITIVIGGGTPTPQNAVTIGGFNLDSMPPLAPNAATFVVPTGAPANLISTQNVANAVFDISQAAGFEAGVSLQVEFSDATTSIASAPVSPSAGSTTTSSPGVDLSGLSDGPISALIVATDSAGNQSSFSPSALTKDTAINAATGVFLPMTASNPINVVNASNQSSASFRVTMSAGTSDEEIRLTITNGTTTTQVGPQPAPVGGGNVDFNGVDLSAFADGPLSVSASVSDSAGNIANMQGSPVLIDTQFGSVTSAQIPAGASNASNEITAASEGSVLLQITVDSLAQSGDQIAIDFSGSGGGVVSMNLPLSSNGPGSETFGPFDLSGLADGNVAINSRLIDGSGNQSPVIGATATKDSSAPAAPASVTVPMQGSAPSGFVNASTQASTLIRVTLAAPAESGSTVDLSVSDGFGGTLTLSSSPSAGSNPIDFTVDLSSLGDGALTFTASVTDASGNGSPNSTGSATLDRIIVAPNAGNINAGVGRPADTISASNETSVDFVFAFGTGSLASDQVNGSLGLGGSQVPVAFAPNGGAGTTTASGIDASSLPDGQLALGGSVSDAAGNSVNFGPFFFDKDTTPPVQPTSLGVAAGGSNAANEINASNQNATLVDIAWDTSMVGNETASLTISDGSSSLPFGPFTPPAGGGSAQVGPFDLSSLADGAISLSMSLSDFAGNSSTGNGTAANKLTVSFAAPTSFNVAASASNLIDIINQPTESSVSVELQFPVSYDGTESATIRLLDGVNPAISVGPMSIPVGGGSVTFSGIDSSSLNDGSINLEVDVSGAAPTQTYSGTTALKDVIPPALVGASIVSGGGNPINSVMPFNETSATVSNRFRPLGRRQRGRQLGAHRRRYEPRRERLQSQRWRWQQHLRPAGLLNSP